MWRKRTQEVGVSKHEKEKAGRGDTAIRSVKESERAQ